jgi:hypothetical protein
MVNIPGLTQLVMAGHVMELLAMNTGHVDAEQEHVREKADITEH